MTATTDKPAQQLENTILETHRQFLSSKEINSVLSPINKLGIDQFKEAGFPHSRNEMFTYVKLEASEFEPFFKKNIEEVLPAHSNLQSKMATRKQGRGDERVLLVRRGADDKVDVGAALNANWNQNEIEKYIYPECKQSIIVVLNGKFAPQFSDLSKVEKNLKCARLSEAGEKKITGLMSAYKAEKDIFASLSNAFLEEGLVLEIAANSYIETPIQILYYSSATPNSHSLFSPGVFITFGKNSDSKLICRYAGTNSTYMINSNQNITVEEGAKLSFTQVQEDKYLSRSFSKTKITQAGGSNVLINQALSGSTLTRFNYEANLNGEGAEFILNAVSMLSEKEEAHNHIRVIHNSPECKSFQHYSNFLFGKTLSSIDTTVIVAKGAKHTESRQLVNNTLMSGECAAYTKPNLMIYADDVKCSHGATSGNLQSNQLFYMQSRGIDERKAKKMIIAGIVSESLKECGSTSISKEITMSLINKIENDVGAGSKPDLQ